MTDELPQMPRRPLLDTYVQRFMRLGGRIMVVTVIVGLIGGYVGGRAFDAVQQNAGPAPQPNPQPQPNPDPGPQPEPEPEPEPSPADWDGQFTLASSDMNSGQGAFDELVVEIRDGKLIGHGILRGQTGPGPIDLDAVVSADGVVEGDMRGALPYGGAEPDMDVGGRIRGRVDERQLSLEFSAKAGYTDLFGEMLLNRVE